MNRLILASGSPRRKALLQLLGISFDTLTVDIDETFEKDIIPSSVVETLSFKKAKAAANVLIKEKKTDNGHIILAADTIVVYNGEILGKPKDRQEAYGMLTTLSGNVHTVFTGYTCFKKENENEKIISGYEQTYVEFRKISDSEINSYINTPEPMDKAGSYGIQGVGGIFVKRIQGDYFNVVGLPICKISQLLMDEFDFNIL